MYDRDGLFLLVNPGGSKLLRWRYRFGTSRCCNAADVPAHQLPASCLRTPRAND